MLHWKHGLMYCNYCQSTSNLKAMTDNPDEKDKRSPRGGGRRSHHKLRLRIPRISAI